MLRALRTATGHQPPTPRAELPAGARCAEEGTQRGAHTACSPAAQESSSPDSCCRQQPGRGEACQALCPLPRRRCSLGAQPARARVRSTLHLQACTTWPRTFQLSSEPQQGLCSSQHSRGETPTDVPDLLG